MIERFIALAWIFVSISPVLAQSSKPSSSEQPRPIKIEDRLSDPVYVAWTSEPSVAQCVRCHLNDKGTEFSRQREMRDWIDRDKHAIARQRVEPFSPENQETELLDLFTRLNRLALKQAAEEEAKGYTLDRSAIGLREVPAEWIGTSNLLSRRMCDKLWGEGTVETAAGYQRFREACLTCHGGVSQEQTASAESLSDYPIGIDCLYCHQQGEQDAWQKEHLDEDRWRLSSPRQKESRGMSDMVDTANQASTCLDCHVGNRDKNMFVTHQMYAAGHPPLPAIEVQTFCDQLPMHWQTPSQLHDNLQDGKSRDEYFAINYPGVAEGGPQQFSETYFDTRKLFIGALQARRKSVKLLVDSAATDDWGDYALYDCAACHHELRSESARQRRYLTATRSVVPGRPRQPEWHAVLTDVAYRLNGKQAYADLGKLESRLRDCFDAKPFGSAAAVRQVGRELIDAIDETVSDVSRRPFNGTLTVNAIKVLCDTDVSRLLTYDAARQIVWAMNVMIEEAEREGVVFSEATRRALSQLNDPAVTGLDVDLPAGRGQFIYPDYLNDAFERRAAFEPTGLKAVLDDLGRSLEAGK